MAGPPVPLLLHPNTDPARMSRSRDGLCDPSLTGKSVRGSLRRVRIRDRPLRNTTYSTLLGRYS